MYFQPRRADKSDIPKKVEKLEPIIGTFFLNKIEG
jgi:hypothetical protein